MPADGAQPVFDVGARFLVRERAQVIGREHTLAELVEKYDVLVPGRVGGGGEYPLQDGFGWTNGVMRKLMALYPADANVRSPAQCPKVEDVTP